MTWSVLPRARTASILTTIVARGAITRRAFRSEEKEKKSTARNENLRLRGASSKNLRERKRERERTKTGDQTGNKETMEERRTKKERMILAAGVWRNERKREVEEDLEGGREREREKGADKKKRSSKLTAASGRPRRDGESPSSENSSPVFLGLAALPTAALSPVSLSSYPSLRPLLSPSLSRLFLRSPRVLPCHDPYPTISLAPLEARQMSGIRLRHLSVSSSVTFDSRQIERRARQGEGGRKKTRGGFLPRGPVTRQRR